MLVFISDNLMKPSIKKLLNLQEMIPVSYGIATGKMFTYSKNTISVTPSTRRWGGENIFGVIFNIPDKPFYLRRLDSYYGCSLSFIQRNHRKDISHRVKQTIQIIDPKTLHDLEYHKYHLTGSVECWMWMANKEHPKIIPRINRSDRYRVRPGANVEALKEAFQFFEN